MAGKTGPKKKTPPRDTKGKEITRKVPRSAKTGLFVTEAFAKSHPSTTEIETVKVKVSQRKKRP